MRPVRNWRDALTVAGFLAPVLALIAVFMVWPAVWAVVQSFTNKSLTGPTALNPEFVGLENYRSMPDDPLFFTTVKNTLYFSAAFIPLSILVGLVLALLCHGKRRGMRVFRTAFFVPYVVNVVAVSLVWFWFYSPTQGVINGVLSTVGIDGPAWLVSTRWAMPAIIFLTVWKSFGYNMVLFLAGLQGIPEQLYEAATIDGANAWQRFRHITVPMLSPTTFFVVIISIIGSFQVFDQALVMTGGGPGVATTTLVLFIYQVGFQSFQMGYAAAAAWLLFVVVMVFTVIQFQAQRRWVTYE